MRKIFFILFLLSFYPESRVAFAFDPYLYNPECNLISKGCLLTLDKINDVDWLLDKIADITRYINEREDSPLVHHIRAYFIQFLYEAVSGADNKIKVANLGIRYVVEGLKIHEDYLPLKFWLATFVGEKYLFLGPGLLKHVPFILSSLKEVVEKDPRCCMGAPLFILGRYYYKLPQFPVSFGNPELSIVYLRRAISVNPNLILPYLYLAEALYATGRKREALTVLKRAERIKPRCWMELMLFKKFRKGIGILRKGFENGTWSTRKDIYKVIQLNSP